MENWPEKGLKKYFFMNKDKVGTPLGTFQTYWMWFLNCEGVSPVTRLNTDMKLVLDLKPRLAAMASMV